MTKKKPDQKPESELVSGTGTDVAALVKLITNLTGREPTPQELQEAQDTLSGKRAPSSYVSMAWPPFAHESPPNHSILLSYFIKILLPRSNCRISSPNLVPAILVIWLILAVDRSYSLRPIWFFSCRECSG
jgi:hypothetical protein